MNSIRLFVCLFHSKTHGQRFLLPIQPETLSIRSAVEHEPSDRLLSRQIGDVNCASARTRRVMCVMAIFSGMRYLILILDYCRIRTNIEILMYSLAIKWQPECDGATMTLTMIVCRSRSSSLGLLACVAHFSDTHSRSLVSPPLCLCLPFSVSPLCSHRHRRCRACDL